MTLIQYKDAVLAVRELLVAEMRQFHVRQIFIMEIPLLVL